MATGKPFLLITKDLTEKEIEQLTDIVGADCIARHMPRVLSASADFLDIEIAFNKRGELVVAIDGKEISGQRDLRINSNHNEVVNVDVNFILTKKSLRLNEV